MREEIYKRLQNSSEEGYKKFSCKLNPTVDPDSVMGVRIPVLRALAKELAKGDFREYIQELPEDCAFEERMIHGMILGYCKVSWEEWCQLVEGFVPHIKDWATCDSAAMTMKIIQKHPEEGWTFLQQFLSDKGEYARRFGAVMLLANFIREDYADRVLAAYEEMDREPYYVMMAVAWGVSHCYTAFPQKTEQFLKKESLDVKTHNKAIQKIRESYRVDREDKDRLKEMKRK